MTFEITPTRITPGGGTTEEQQTINRLFTFDAMQRVSISAIVADVVTDSNAEAPAEGEPQPTPNPADVRVRAYLFALTPQDALVLKHMRDAGATFDIVLRSPTSNELFELSPVTVDYLIQRFELSIPK
jgi:hypothetical protein